MRVLLRYIEAFYSISNICIRYRAQYKVKKRVFWSDLQYKARYRSFFYSISNKRILYRSLMITISNVTYSISMFCRHDIECNVEKYSISQFFRDKSSISKILCHSRYQSSNLRYAARLPMKERGPTALIRIIKKFILVHWVISIQIIVGGLAGMRTHDWIRSCHRHQKSKQYNKPDIVLDIEVYTRYSHEKTTISNTFRRYI